MRCLDIAIAGAGPGGLAAELFPGRAGRRVRVVERFAAPQPVGSGPMLQPTGLVMLHALGLHLRLLAGMVARPLPNALRVIGLEAAPMGEVR